MIDTKHKKDLIEIADKLGYEEQPMQLIEEIERRRCNSSIGDFFDDFLFVIELIISISLLLLSYLILFILKAIAIFGFLFIALSPFIAFIISDGFK